MREIYFHEDDFCMCELQPLSQYQTVCEQMGRDRGVKSDVLGRESISSIVQLKLTYTQVYNLLCSYFIPFDKISNEVFLATDLEPSNLQAAAFGNNNENVVFFSYDKHTEIIRHIWFSFYPASEEALKDTKELLVLLSRLEDFLLVDWYAEQVVSLEDHMALDNYCQLLLTYS